MEFIMTYGWAILVVLIAVGGLAYFGVLNFNNNPLKCRCSDVDMYHSQSIKSNNLTYVECRNMGEKYIDYDNERIMFNETFKIFYCDTEIKELVEV